MGNPKTLSLTVLISLLYFTLQVVSVFAVMKAYGLDLSFWVAGGVMTIVRFGTVVPNAPGNVGLFQASCVLALGLLLFAIFGLWLMAAHLIWLLTLGPEAPAAVDSFIRDVLTTTPGWTMAGVGIGVGFLFALLVLTVSVVSFPLLLDRDIGVATAISTSYEVVRANPGPMALWGLIIAAGLVIGAIPLLLGLAIVFPVLGHATPPASPADAVPSPGPSAPPPAPVLSARRPAMLACPADGYRVTMTLPTVPLSAAWCAAAMSASGYLRTGSPVSSPAASAAVMSAAAWSSAVISTP